MRYVEQPVTMNEYYVARSPFRRFGIAIWSLQTIIGYCVSPPVLSTSICWCRWNRSCPIMNVAITVQGFHSMSHMPLGNLWVGGHSRRIVVSLTRARVQSRASTHSIVQIIYAWASVLLQRASMMTSTQQHWAGRSSCLLLV
jgi:hypothetical protein